MMITDSSKRVIPFRERDAKRIGEGCFYLDSIVWLNGDRIELGDNVGFNVGCFINGFSGLIVGDGTNFGPYSMVHTANHNMEDTERPVTEQGWRDEPPVRIGRNCWIGMGAMILPGVQVGDGAVIGAGCGGRARRRGLRGRRREPGQDGAVAQVRVLFLQQQPCVRALKYAVGLGRRGRARLRLPRAHAVRALRRRRRAVRGLVSARRGPGGDAAGDRRGVRARRHPLPQPPRRADRARARHRRRAGHPRRPRHAEPAAHALRGRLSRARATRWRSSGGRRRSRRR